MINRSKTEFIHEQVIGAIDRHKDCHAARGNSISPTVHSQLTQFKVDAIHNHWKNVDQCWVNAVRSGVEHLLEIIPRWHYLLVQLLKMPLELYISKSISHPVLHQGLHISFHFIFKTKGAAHFHVHFPFSTTKKASNFHVHCTLYTTKGAAWIFPYSFHILQGIRGCTLLVFHHVLFTIYTTSRAVHFYVHFTVYTTV